MVPRRGLIGELDTVLAVPSASYRRCESNAALAFIIAALFWAIIASWARLMFLRCASSRTRH